MRGLKPKMSKAKAKPMPMPIAAPPAPDMDEAAPPVAAAPMPPPPVAPPAGATDGLGAGMGGLAIHPSAKGAAIHGREVRHTSKTR